VIYKIDDNYRGNLSSDEELDIEIKEENSKHDHYQKL
jgi:hypothetical protein